MKTKITALLVAALMTAGTFGAALPQKAEAQTAKDASIIINFCKIAHRKFMQGDKGAYLHSGMSQLTEANRPVVALACAAYGTGFDVGTRSLV